jgi:hypothetical protein
MREREEACAGMPIVKEYHQQEEGIKRNSSRRKKTVRWSTGLCIDSVTRRFHLPMKQTIEKKRGK